MAPAVRHAVGHAAVDAEAFRAAMARANAGNDGTSSGDSASNGKERLMTKDTLASGYGTDGIALAPVAVKGSTVTAIESSVSRASPLKSIALFGAAAAVNAAQRDHVGRFCFEPTRSSSRGTGKSAREGL